MDEVKRKIQETKAFRRNVAAADYTSANVARVYPAGRVFQRPKMDIRMMVDPKNDGSGTRRVAATRL
jgi:hypothetical protein